MDYDYIFSQEDLVENPTPRVPVCLCLDVSGSMYGAPINELNSGIRQFYEAIQADEVALYAAEICIVTCGGDFPECISDFARLQNRDQMDIIPPTLQASGATPLGEAINMSLDKLEKRKNDFKNKGVDYYQPWLIVMTDGEPTGSRTELSRAISRVQNSIAQRKLTVFPIGIGKDANMQVLDSLSKDGKGLKLQELKFREFFEWLSQSVSKTSESMPGDKVEVDEDGIKVWGWKDL